MVTEGGGRSVFGFVLFGFFGLFSSLFYKTTRKGNAGICVIDNLQS